MSKQAPPPGLPGLDWLNFFVATLQTGFGPFIAVYLTTNRWTQASIGLALGVGTAVTVLSQVPAGLLVDRLRSKRAAVLAAVLLVAASALLLAQWPQVPSVLSAQALHGFASCMLMPAIAAVTLALTGPTSFADRIGRNARFSALGNASGALLMGLCGTLLNSRSVFWLAAMLAAPALAALVVLRRSEAATTATASPAPPMGNAWTLLRDPRLLAFAGCVLLFHLCNAALLPLAAGALTRRAGDAANLLIAACIVGPQIVVVLLAASAATYAERWGRRPVMLLGFTALPLRAVVFAGTADPTMVVAAQLLDGVSAAAFGVLVPLVAADLTRGTGRFNLCLGVVGLATGVGATVSTILSGWLATEVGTHAAFLALVIAGVAAVFAVELAMPETGTSAGAWRAAHPGAG
jgi:MFS family permease